VQAHAHLCNGHLFQVFLHPQPNLSLQLNLTPKLNRAHLCNGHLFQVFSPALESLTEQPAITSQARSHQGLLPICPQELRVRRGEIKPETHVPSFSHLLVHCLRFTGLIYAIHKHIHASPCTHTHTHTHTHTQNTHPRVHSNVRPQHPHLFCPPHPPPSPGAHARHATSPAPPQTTCPSHLLPHLLLRHG
jgi:hypothetical protein